MKYRWFGRGLGCGDGRRRHFGDGKIGLAMVVKIGDRVGDGLKRVCDGCRGLEEG